MTMRNNATSRRGKTLLSILRAAINRDAPPLATSPHSLLAQAEAFCREGDILFKQRDWEGATDSYRAAVALDADHPDAHPLLVDALYRRAHARPDVAAYKDETLAACQEALRLHPDCSAAAHFLMRMLQDLGRQAEAYRLHEKTTLNFLTYAMGLLTEALNAEKRSGGRDLPTRLLFLEALMLHACRLSSAYEQESQGEPIDWDGYLSEPVDTADPA
jgi:tetratricopeptide (TPR) repeat protein